MRAAFQRQGDEPCNYTQESTFFSPVSTSTDEKFSKLVPAAGIFSGTAPKRP